MTDWRTLTLEQARVLPEPDRGKAIYFLWRGEELLYIGASTQVSERVTRQAQFRDFGHVSMSAASREAGHASMVARIRASDSATPEQK